jgi:hypothetical protein
MKPFAHITYHKSQESIETDNPEIDAVLSQHYRHFMLNYLNCDYTRYTQTMVKRESICFSLRPQGGVYVIPAKDRAMVYKLKDLFEIVDPEGDFHITEIPDLDGAKEAIASAYEPVMDKMCEDLEAKLCMLESKGKELTPEKRIELFNEVCFMGKDIELMMDVAEYDLANGKSKLEALNEHIINFTPVKKDDAVDDADDKEPEMEDGIV